MNREQLGSTNSPAVNQQLESKKQDYRRWVTTYGPHSHQGLFYRQVLRHLESDYADFYRLAVEQINQLNLFPDHPDQAEKLRSLIEAEFGKPYSHLQMLDEIRDLTNLAKLDHTEEVSLDHLVQATLVQFINNYLEIFTQEPSEVETWDADAAFDASIFVNESLFAHWFSDKNPFEKLLTWQQIQEVEPYNSDIFHLELITRKKHSKLRIRRELVLLPELSHVEAEWLDFDFDKLKRLAEIGLTDNLLKILATLREWELTAGVVVQFDGIIDPEKKPPT